MSLPLKWLLLWSVLFVMLLAWLWWPTSSDVPPWPQTITSLSLPNGNLHLERDAAGQWHSSGHDINAAQQALIQRWVTDLRLGCDRAYPADAVPPQANTQFIPFSVNGDAYRFGAFNTYTQRHYLYHDGRVYLCIPTLAPRLHNAHRLWMTPHA